MNVTRRSFMKLFIVGFVSGVANELAGDDDDDDGG